MKIEILKGQTQDSYDWTNKLLKSIPFDAWEMTPEIIESNVSWQAGHLILSTYYHSINVIVGHQRDLLEAIPMKKYAALYTNSEPGKAVEAVGPEVLFDQLSLIQNRSIEIISSLSDDDLKSDLEPTRMKHPIATNKFEAIDWNVKHTMWHCGQISIIKRIVHERFDFGFNPNG